MSEKKKFYALSIPQISEREKQLVKECLDSGWVSSSGPWVDRFEEVFAKAVEKEKAVSVTSGTAALHLALIAAGVKSNEEVLVPSLTFIAPVNAIKYIQAEPVFFDCDDKLNLDLDKINDFIENGCEKKGRALYNKLSKRRVAAIVPVHIHGHLVNVRLLKEMVKDLDIAIIEDATESLGSRWIDGFENSYSGTRGDFGCYSFNGNKIITTGGGGMVVAKNAKDLAFIKHLSTQAKADELTFEHDAIGFNYRLNSLSAAFGIGQLEQLKSFIEKKRQIANWYSKKLQQKDFARVIEEPHQTQSNYWLIAAETKKEFAVKKLVSALSSDGIQCRPLWMLSHLQKPYLQNQSWKIEKATNISPRILTLPSCPDLTETDIAYIVEKLEARLTS